MVVAVRRGLIVVAVLSVFTGAGAARSQLASSAGAVSRAGSVSSSAGTSPQTGAAAGGRVCNGLIAFASNREQYANSEIYSVSLDGHRTDISRTSSADSDPQPSLDGSKVAFWTKGQLTVANADG